MASPEQSWSKLYDGWQQHPKFLKAGATAAYIYFAGQSYCSAQETDGIIPKEATRALAGADPGPYRAVAAIKALVRVGLWHDRGDHFEQHDFCEMQRTSADREVVRAQARARKQKQRARGNGTVPELDDVTRDTTVTSRKCHADSVEESRVEKSTASTPSPSGEGPLDSEKGSVEEGPAKAQGPTARKGPYDESNPFHADIVALSEEFWGHADHPTPDTAQAIGKALNEVRLILAKDMADMPKDERGPRLVAILKAALDDDFWARQIRSLSGLRNRGMNGLRKWQNAEAGLKGGNGSNGPDGKPWTSLTPLRQRKRQMGAYER